MFTDEVLAHASFSFEMRRREGHGEIISNLRVTVASSGGNPARTYSSKLLAKCTRQYRPLKAACEIRLDKWI